MEHQRTQMTGERRSGSQVSIRPFQALSRAAGLSLLMLAAPLATPAIAAPGNNANFSGPTPEEPAEPSWPQVKNPSPDAPNVLVIMTDDVGFGSTATFGGRIETPVFDALSRQGLRYNTFNTAGICSPTRAALLTGRIPQNVGMGYVSNWAAPHEGYNSRIPESAATMAGILKQAGYNTAMLGKGHITPEWEMSAAGPFDRWPTGLGFEYYYGFLGADTSQFEPTLVENTQPVSVDTDAEDYLLDQDLADKAIAWLAGQHAADPDRPFLMYFATGTAHAPNHAPSSWLDHYDGAFDDGWDVLREETVARQKELGVIPADATDAARPDTLARWDDLPAEERDLYARYMEAYAASLTFADMQVGRILDTLEAQGELENTLIIYIQGDNGASEEGRLSGKIYEQSALSGVREELAYAKAHQDEIGGPATYPLLPGGWGWAMNAPFPQAKRFAGHLGGTRNAMVVSWPERLGDHAGELRSQYHFVSDVMPTILEAAGIDAPDTINGVPRQPVDGVSMLYSFEQPDAPGQRDIQVYATGEEMGLYRDGWLASAKPAEDFFASGHSPAPPLDERVWELFDLTTDFSQSHDLSAERPDQLEEMKQLFWIEAARNQILPIHSSAGLQDGRPDPAGERTRFVYTRPVSRVPEAAAPQTIGQSFRIEATASLADSSASGVIVAHGGRFAGYSMFLEEGRLTFTYNQTPARVTRVQASEAVSAGTHEFAVAFEADEDRKGTAGTLILTIDGHTVAETRLPSTFPLIVSHTEGFDVGSDTVTPVDPAYSVNESAFQGRLEEVVFILEP